MPHLAIGYVAWTLLGGFWSSSGTLISRHRAFVIQGGMKVEQIVMMELTKLVIQFLHQVPLIIGILLYYGVEQNLKSFLSLLGLLLIIVNGRSVLVIFGILSLRYRDMPEVIMAVIRMAFLATPIIWMAGDDGRSGLIGPYTIYNPFYHFLEIFRAPLLNKDVEPLTWIVVIIFTVIGMITAEFFKRRFKKQVPLWL